MHPYQQHSGDKAHACFNRFPQVYVPSPPSSDSLKTKDIEGENYRTFSSPSHHSLHHLVMTRIYYIEWPYIAVCLWNILFEAIYAFMRKNNWLQGTKLIVTLNTNQVKPVKKKYEKTNLLSIFWRIKICIIVLLHRKVGYDKRLKAM